MEQTTSAPQTSLAAALVGIAGTLRKSPKEAGARAREILRIVPGQHQALLLMVSAARVAGDIAGARATLESMAQADPNLASVQYELALLLADVGERAAAISALRRVVGLEPRHPNAWRDLGDLLAQAGEGDEARQAYARHFGSCVAEVQLLESAAALSGEQIASGEAILRESLKVHPTDVSVIRMLAEIGLKLQHPEQAGKLFARALELAPEYPAARFGYASALRQQENWGQALEQLDMILKDDPHHLMALNMKAAVLMSIGDYAGSIGCHETLLANHPDQPEAWMHYGHALRTIGRQKDAIAAYRKGLALQPSLGEAYWNLANLKTYKLTPVDIKAMHTELGHKHLSNERRALIHFALGKALEDAKSYAPSFQHYAQANALVRQSITYDARETTEFVRRSKRLFTRDFFAARKDQGCAAPDPIFIVGMPRSGSTLVEQILSSHSVIEGTMELSDMTLIARRLVDEQRSKVPDADYPEALARLKSRDLKALGEEYLARTRIQRKLGRAFFIDKMPGNINHLGMIHLALPRAKIIDVRRHPVGCGLANFKQYFGRVDNFTYDLSEIGKYYRDYVDLMAHFDAVLPGRVHRLHYEHLIADPESEVRRLLAYCGLPFEEACLRFYETRRGVRTSSSEQVRQPLFKDGMKQWQHYDAWLGPLKEALGDAVDAYPAVNVPDMAA